MAGSQLSLSGVITRQMAPTASRDTQREKKTKWKLILLRKEKYGSWLVLTQVEKLIHHGTRTKAAPDWWQVIQPSNQERVFYETIHRA